MIPQNQISKLSNRLFREQGGRRILENVLERDYCIAWFLIGISQRPIRSKLVFKGGTALSRCYFLNYRFSEDLDFSLLQPLSVEEIFQELEGVYAEVKKLSNITFRFSRNDPQTHKNSYTFYLAYEGPLPATSKPKEVKVDITINERIYYPPAEIPVLKNYGEYTDILENQKIFVYPITEIVSEKTIALHDRARTEPRDLYDLWYILTEQMTTVPDCMDGIRAKLEHRGKELDQIKEEFTKKEARLKKTWEQRLSTQVSVLPEFDWVFRAVKRSFRQAMISK